MQPMLPILLISNTPSNDSSVTQLPLLTTKWLQPAITFGDYDGVVLTSKNGVKALERIDPSWKKLPVLCVGNATKSAAESVGAHIIDCGSGYGDDIYDLIRERHAQQRWLYARPKVAASDFAERLREAGIVIDDAVVYETVCSAQDIEAEIPDKAVLIFTSPSALHCFQSRFTILPSHTLVVIGKTTQKALAGHQVHVAPEPAIASCVALAKQLAKEEQ